MQQQDPRTADGRSAETENLLPLVAASHVDHGLTDEQVEYIRREFATRTAFFMVTIELPEALGTAPCGLHGPIMGDAPVDESEVFHRARRDRAYTSRLCNRPHRETRLVSVIGGPHEGLPCVLYTAFGGPISPREPGDPTLTDEHLREHSVEFWREHALSA